MAASKDLTGVRFHKLLVLSDSGSRTSNGSILWNCLCDCGNTTLQISTPLKSGLVKTCGCSKSDPENVFKKSIKASKTRLGDLYFECPKERSLVYKYKLDSKKSIARNKIIEFKLAFQEYKDLVLQNCHYCGKPPNNLVTPKRKFGCESIHVSGIDRKDSDGDYEVSNCVPCCIECNSMKNNMNYEQFISWVKSVIQHQKLAYNSSATQRFHPKDVEVYSGMVATRVRETTIAGD